MCTRLEALALSLWAVWRLVSLRSAPRHSLPNPCIQHAALCSVAERFWVWRSLRMPWQSSLSVRATLCVVSASASSNAEKQLF